MGGGRGSGELPIQDQIARSIVLDAPRSAMRLGVHRAWGGSCHDGKAVSVGWLSSKTPACRKGAGHRARSAQARGRGEGGGVEVQRGKEASGALGLHTIRMMGRPYNDPNETRVCRMSKRGEGEALGPGAGGAMSSGATVTAKNKGHCAVPPSKGAPGVQDAHGGRCRGVAYHIPWERQGCRRGKGKRVDGRVTFESS